MSPPLRTSSDSFPRASPSCIANITDPADFMIPLAWDKKPANSSGKFSWKFSVRAIAIRSATGVARSLNNPIESATQSSLDSNFGSMEIGPRSVASSSHRFPVAVAVLIERPTDSGTALVFFAAIFRAWV